MPTTTVKGCDDCPFYANQTTCQHPDTIEVAAWKNRYREAVRKIDGPIRNQDLPPHPDWCPLLREAITVTLIKD